MIAIVNSGVANLTSVQAAFDRLGAKAEITDDPAVIMAADRVILPGVGAAPAAMESLRAKGLDSVIRALSQPVLGICLGMQLMFEDSSEGVGAQGLGLLPGHVQLLPSTQDAPIPHMGWNQLEIKDRTHPLVKDVAEGAFVYYVHSFAVPVGLVTVAQTTYTAPFTAIAALGNFMGCQFHPERSGAVGRQILINFMQL